jgi:PEP-CTERM motif
MKLLRCAVIILAVAFIAAVAQKANAAATIYNDATGDVNVDGTYYDHLDIASVEVNNDATDIMFKINLVGDPVAVNWGKYCVGIDSVAGGDTTSDGWARPISMSSGMDYWAGSWVDAPPSVQSWAYSGAWNLTMTYPVAVDSSSVSFSIPLADFGLSPGDVIAFDVYATGGGGTDSAIDALANPNVSVTNWAGPYDSGQLVDFYTVIPEPSTLLLVGLGGLVLVGKLFRKRV